MYLRQNIVLLILLSICLQVSSQNKSTNSWSKYDQIKVVFSKNTSELAEQIIAPFSTKEEKTKAIYYWITNNIAYDVKLFNKMEKSGKLGKSEKYTMEQLRRKRKSDIKRTLSKKKGVCHHYSLLFDKLCEEVNINCEYIGGYSKTDPEKSGKGIAHAWNAVFYDKNWHLIDLTYSSGYVDNDEFEFYLLLIFIQ